MMIDLSNDIKNRIFASIQKKIGNVPIRLDTTPNKRARLTMGSCSKDFVNQTDALQWLIHSYNIKDMKKSVQIPILVSDNNLSNLRNRNLNDAAHTIYEKIIELGYYSTEVYRSVVTDLKKLETEEEFNAQEIDLVLGIVIEMLQRLMDETVHYKRSQTYKKYSEQLSMIRVQKTR
jgi:hypothetical protein